MVSVRVIGLRAQGRAKDAAGSSVCGAQEFRLISRRPPSLLLHTQSRDLGCALSFARQHGILRPGEPNSRQYVLGAERFIRLRGCAVFLRRSVRRNLRRRIAFSLRCGRFGGAVAAESFE